MRGRIDGAKKWKDFQVRINVGTQEMLYTADTGDYCLWVRLNP